jgi:hypothetical protein
MSTHALPSPQLLNVTQDYHALAWLSSRGVKVPQHYDNYYNLFGTCSIAHPSTDLSAMPSLHTCPYRCAPTLQLRSIKLAHLHWLTVQLQGQKTFILGPPAGIHHLQLHPSLHPGYRQSQVGAGLRALCHDRRGMLTLPVAALQLHVAQCCCNAL